jgi:hypothetical protein
MWNCDAVLAVGFLLLSFLVDVTSFQSMCPLMSLQQHESSVYSQNGEDGVILALLSIIGTSQDR